MTKWNSNSVPVSSFFMVICYEWSIVTYQVFDYDIIEINLWYLSPVPNIGL